jgi:hypothetical protein
MAKLTLRDLFAVVTIVALALGWSLDHSKMSATQTTITNENLGLRRDVKLMADRLVETHHQVFFTPEGGVNYLQYREGDLDVTVSARNKPSLSTLQKSPRTSKGDP